MGESGFYLFVGAVALIFSLGYWWGNSGFENELSKNCDQRNEMVISGKVYSCKAVALINNGIRADLK